jgi:tetratricopeptide (TPR) repeat protein
MQRVLAVILLMIGTAKPLCGQLVFHAYSKDGTPLVECEAVRVDRDSVVVPWFAVCGAAKIALDAHGASCVPARIARDSGSCVAKINTTTLPDTERICALRPLDGLLGVDLFEHGPSGRPEGPPVARVVAFEHVGSTEAPTIETYADVQLRFGACLFDKDGALCGMLVDPAIASHETGTREWSLCSAQAIRGAEIDSALVPGTPQDAVGRKRLLDAKEHESVVQAVQEMRSSGANWYEGLSDDLRLMLISEMVEGNRWTEVAELASTDTTGRRTPDDAIKFEIAAALASIVQGRAGIDSLDRLGDSLGTQGQWARPAIDSLAGSVLMASSDPEGAATRFRAVHARWPRDAAPLTGLLECLKSGGDKERYFQAAKELQAVDWRDRSALRCAYQLIKWDEAEKAEALLSVALTRSPESGDLRLAMARALGLQGKWEQATRDVEAAVRNSEDDHAWREGWEILEVEGDPEKLKAYAKRWQAKGPSEDSCVLPSAWAVKRASWDLAVSFAERGADRYGSDVSYATLLAGVYQRAGRAADATRAAKKAVEAHPDSGDAWLLVAAMAEQQGQWAECESACKRALTLIPKSGPALGMLVESYRGLGREEDAAKALEALRALSPSRATEPGGAR